MMAYLIMLAIVDFNYHSLYVLASCVLCLSGL